MSRSMNLRALSPASSMAKESVSEASSITGFLHSFESGAAVDLTGHALCVVHVGLSIPLPVLS